MAEPFLAEIRMMSFNFPPKGWALCNGQLLPINQNQGLFSLLGTTYGGNGQSNFALPNLQGRVPVHMGNGISLGQSAGTTSHTLTLTEMPTHTHVANGSTQAGSSPVVAGNALAGVSLYAAPTNLVALAAATLQSVGGSQAHTNMQPFLTISFCIALQGIFPSQT
ncbi:MAG: tail fiber protein [Roseiflexaceae bacterium]